MHCQRCIKFCPKVFFLLPSMQLRLHWEHDEGIAISETISFISYNDFDAIGLLPLILTSYINAYKATCRQYKYNFVSPNIYWHI